MALQLDSSGRPAGRILTDLSAGKLDVMQAIGLLHLAYAPIYTNPDEGVGESAEMRGDEMAELEEEYLASFSPADPDEDQSDWPDEDK